MGTLRELIPPSVWGFIARDARRVNTSSELMQLAMNQLLDPKAGMLKGEKAPMVNNPWQPQDEYGGGVDAAHRAEAARGGRVGERAGRSRGGGAGARR